MPHLRLDPSAPCLACQPSTACPSCVAAGRALELASGPEVDAATVEERDRLEALFFERIARSPNEREPLERMRFAARLDLALRRPGRPTPSDWRSFFEGVPVWTPFPSPGVVVSVVQYRYGVVEVCAAPV